MKKIIMAATLVIACSIGISELHAQSGSNGKRAEREQRRIERIHATAQRHMERRYKRYERTGSYTRPRRGRGAY